MRLYSFCLLLFPFLVNAQQLQFQDGKLVLPHDQGSVSVDAMVNLADQQFGISQQELFADIPLTLMMGFYAKRIAKKRVFLAVGVVLFPPLLPAGLSQAGAAKAMKDQIALYLVE